MIRSYKLEEINSEHSKGNLRNYETKQPGKTGKKRHYEQRILETVHNFFWFTEIIEAISSQLD